MSFSPRLPPPETIIAPPLPSPPRELAGRLPMVKKKNKTKQNKRQEKLEEEIILYENVLRNFR